MKKQDSKTKCARLCAAAVVRCAKDVEKAMASCGVECTGLYDDEPVGIIEAVLAQLYDLAYYGGNCESISRWKPDAEDIENIAREFRKIRAKRKARAGK